MVNCTTTHGVSYLAWCYVYHPIISIPHAIPDPGRRGRHPFPTREGHHAAQRLVEGWSGALEHATTKRADSGAPVAYIRQPSHTPQQRQPRTTDTPPHTVTGQPAGPVRQRHAAHAKGKSQTSARIPSPPGRAAILCAYTTIGKTPRPESSLRQSSQRHRASQIGVRQQRCERRGAEDGKPDHPPSADAVTSSPPSRRPAPRQT